MRRFQTCRAVQSIFSRANTANLIESIASVKTSVVPISAPMTQSGSGVISTPKAASEARRITSQTDASTMIGAGRELHSRPRSRKT
jgi:hypothetical protein